MIGAKTPKNFFWGNKYAQIDGLFCEIITKKRRKINGEYITIYFAKKVNKDGNFYISNVGEFYAHGETLEKSIQDLQFKVAAEKYKSEPINADTIVSIDRYRAITGACEMGVNMWLKENGMSDVLEIKASELLPILKKTNAFGYEKIKGLVTF